MSTTAAARHSCPLWFSSLLLSTFLTFAVYFCGHQSATKLGNFINDCVPFQIELTKNYGMSDWCDDLKQMMLKAGTEGKSLVFLFSDSQIKDEAMLEDIDMLLNMGDVPNIFAADERPDIVEKAQGLKAERSMYLCSQCITSLLTV